MIVAQLGMILLATTAFADGQVAVSFEKRQDGLHCVYSAVDATDLGDAYGQIFQQANNSTFGWLNLAGWSGACASSGETQFYICNNNDEDRQFLFNIDFTLEYFTQYEACDNSGYWYMNDDGWSYGCDPAGTVECGGIIASC